MTTIIHVLPYISYVQACSIVAPDYTTACPHPQTKPYPPLYLTRVDELSASSRSVSSQNRGMSSSCAVCGNTATQGAILEPSPCALSHNSCNAIMPVSPVHPSYPFKNFAMPDFTKLEAVRPRDCGMASTACPFSTAFVVTRPLPPVSGDLPASAMLSPSFTPALESQL